MPNLFTITPKPANAAAAYLDAHPGVAEWFTRERAAGSDFAESLFGYLMRTGSLSDKQLACITRALAKPAQVAAPDAPDLATVPAGYYAIPDGATRLKVRIDKPAKGRWVGYVFVHDGAAYGSRKQYGRQAPGSRYVGEIVEQLRAIIANPRAASAAYGQLVGRCGVCGRLLEDANSIALGIGPICIQKF